MNWLLYFTGNKAVVTNAPKVVDLTGEQIASVRFYYNSYAGEWDTNVYKGIPDGT